VQCACIGYSPHTSWAADPFGHSATMAYLLQRSGVTSMLIQRAHYAIKKYLAYRRQLQFVWHQAWGRFIMVSDGRMFGIVLLSSMVFFLVFFINLLVWFV